MVTSSVKFYKLFNIYKNHSSELCKNFRFIELKAKIIKFNEERAAAAAAATATS